jgi:hypothetical protein
MARRVVLGLVVLVVALATTGEAQRRGRFGQMRVATPADYEAAFQFCRVAYRGGGWAVDYPQADTNISIRLSELTKTRVSFDPARNPNHLIVQLASDELFQCPFVMMTEVGATYLDEIEVRRLREYLLKGGFLWADDFWGTREWNGWEREITRVLPRNEYPIVDLPLDHPILRMQFVANRVPQIPSINYWWGSGGDTSERGYDSQTPTARAIFDSDGRIMVLMTHNTDLGDSWEREGDDPQYFYTFAVEGYAFGINVVLYSMAY